MSRSGRAPSRMRSPASNPALSERAAVATGPGRPQHPQPPRDPASMSRPADPLKPLDGASGLQPPRRSDVCQGTKREAANDHVPGKVPTAEAPPGQLRLYATVPRTQALGPFIRYAIWVQGCPMRCEGCMTPGALPFDGGTQTTVADLASEVLATQGIEGLTISGGEPFAQAGALASLIRMLRERADLGVIVYTGYRLDQLRRRSQSDAGVGELLEQTDLLVHGPFLPARNDGVALRGSDNQTVALLTERYAAGRSLYQSGARRSVEVFVQAGQCMLVGIPSAAQLHWWHGLSHRDRATVFGKSQSNASQIVNKPSR